MQKTPLLLLNLSVYKWNLIGKFMTCSFHEARLFRKTLLFAKDIEQFFQIEDFFPKHQHN